MAIFRAETKHICRSKKHNVVAAAAYRAAEKLTDTNKFNPDAKTHDYTKKKGVLASGIILPTSLIEQDFTLDRQQLWSSVEQSETTTRSVKGSRLKQTARLAREWLLALPSELSDDENEQLTREFTEKLVNDLGVIADYAIHEPTQANYEPKKDFLDWYDPDTNTSEKVQVYDVEPTAPDSRNVHAHIMFTTRKAKLDANSSLVFGDKADSERSEKWRQEQKLCNGGDYIKEIRQLWADLINRRLEQKNILPISAKSYKDLGLNIIPQHKQGKDATVMALYSFTLPIIGLNNDIKRRNDAYLESTADCCIATEPRETEFADKRAREAAEWLSTENRVLEQRVRNPFDRESGAERLKKQTSLFDRLAERENRIPSEPPGVLINKAMRQYNAIIQYEQLSQRRRLAGKDTRPDPRLAFNERQLDIIKNVDAHIKGLKSRYTSYSRRELERKAYSSFDLEKSLTEQVNKPILTLLTNPNKDQKIYEERQEAFQRMVAKRPSLPLVNHANATAQEQEQEQEDERHTRTLKSAPSEVLTPETVPNPNSTPKRALTPEFKPPTPRF